MYIVTLSAILFLMSKLVLWQISILGGFSLLIDTKY